MKLFPLLFTLLFFNLLSNGQNNNIGVGTTLPNPSAALDITDTTRGLLIPRMTLYQRNNIQNPAEGLMIYQVDSSKGFWYYNGSNWVTNYNSIFIDSIINLLKTQGSRIGFSNSTSWVCPNGVYRIKNN